MVVVLTKWSKYGTSVVVNSNSVDAGSSLTLQWWSFCNDANTFCVHTKTEHVLHEPFNLFTPLCIYI